jgi:uncharacterized protein (TIGR02391 family)
VPERFPNEAITSARAQLLHDWILTLAKQPMAEEERNKLLRSFIDQLCPDDAVQGTIHSILESAGLLGDTKSELREFVGRGFHSEVVAHCRKLFSQGNYFHAVFEACKVYNKMVRAKSISSKDGEALMMEVWGWQNGVLKITTCESDTDKNVQDGVKFLSAGLMRAIRNPTSHEPALDWPISKEDCLDMLSFISFLFRQLDKAVYYKSAP